MLMDLCLSNFDIYQSTVAPKYKNSRCYRSEIYSVGRNIVFTVQSSGLYSGLLLRLYLMADELFHYGCWLLSTRHKTSCN